MPGAEGVNWPSESEDDDYDDIEQSPEEIEEEESSSWFETAGEDLFGNNDEKENKARDIFSGSGLFAEKGGEDDEVSDSAEEVDGSGDENDEPDRSIFDMGAELPSEDEAESSIRYNAYGAVESVGGNDEEEEPNEDETVEEGVSEADSASYQDTDEAAADAEQPDVEISEQSSTTGVPEGAQAEQEQKRAEIHEDDDEDEEDEPEATEEEPEATEEEPAETESEPGDEEEGDAEDAVEDSPEDDNPGNAEAEETPDQLVEVADTAEDEPEATEEEPAETESEPGDEEEGDAEDAVEDSPEDDNPGNAEAVDTPEDVELASAVSSEAIDYPGDSHEFPLPNDDLGSAENIEMQASDEGGGEDDPDVSNAESEYLGHAEEQPEGVGLEQNEMGAEDEPEATEEEPVETEAEPLDEEEGALNIDHSNEYDEANDEVDPLDPDTGEDQAEANDENTEENDDVPEDDEHSQTQNTEFTTETDNNDIDADEENDPNNQQLNTQVAALQQQANTLAQQQSQNEQLQPQKGSGAAVVGALLFGEWLGRRRADRKIRSEMRKNQKEQIAQQEEIQRKISALKTTSDQREGYDKLIKQQERYRDELAEELKREISKNTPTPNSEYALNENQKQQLAQQEALDIAGPRVEEEAKKEAVIDTSVTGERFVQSTDEVDEGRERRSGTRLETRAEDTAEYAIAESKDGEQQQGQENVAIEQQNKQNLSEAQFEARREQAFQPVGDDKASKIASPNQGNNIADVLATTELFREDNDTKHADDELPMTVDQPVRLDTNQPPGKDNYRTAAEAGIVMGVVIFILTAIFFIFK